MAALFSDAVALFSRRYAAVHALCSDADLPLFDRNLHLPPATTTPPEDDRLRNRLGKINPDMLAPRDALELLYELRELLDPAPTDSVLGDNE